MNTQDMLKNINDAIDTRIAYENDKNSENATIVKCLNSIRKDMSHDTIANVLIACSYDAATINSAVRNNARRNVYSIEKDANLARAIAAVETLNHYTKAIFSAALALENADMKLTHKDAASACSLDVKHDVAARERIIKTAKYQKHIAANTASTQSSSSINALIALNVLRATSDTEYTLNRECDAFAKLSALIAA